LDCIHVMSPAYPRVYTLSNSLASFCLNAKRNTR
jgi:hypothetical protein